MLEIFMGLSTRGSWDSSGGVLQGTAQGTRMNTCLYPSLFDATNVATGDLSKRLIWSFKCKQFIHIDLAICMKFSLLLFDFLSSATNHGSFKVPQLLCKLETCYQVCGKILWALRDLLCNNDGCSQIGWSPCLNLWHAQCYEQSKTLKW